MDDKCLGAIYLLFALVYASVSFTLMTFSSFEPFEFILNVSPSNGNKSTKLISKQKQKFILCLRTEVVFPRFPCVFIFNSEIATDQHHFSKR